MLHDLICIALLCMLVRCNLSAACEANWLIESALLHRSTLPKRPSANPGFQQLSH